MSEATPPRETRMTLKDRSAALDLVASMKTLEIVPPYAFLEAQALALGFRTEERPVGAGHYLQNGEIKIQEGELAGPAGTVGVRTREEWRGLFAQALIFATIWKVTGIPATEAQALRSKGDQYRRYQQTTSVFVPLPRKREPRRSDRSVV